MFCFSINEEKGINTSIPSKVFQITIKLSKLKWERFVSFSIYGLLVMTMYLLGETISGLNLMALAFLQGIALFAFHVVYWYVRFWSFGDIQKKINSSGAAALILAYILISISKSSLPNFGYVAFLLVSWISLYFCTYLWFYDDNIKWR